MVELQAEISYWISVAIRAVQTFPSFIGNNWVGVLLSFALLLPAVRAHIRNHIAAIRPLAWSGKFFYTGRALMNTNWRTVAAIVGAFWIGNFLTVGFRDYYAASVQARQAGEQLGTAKSQLAASAVNCQLQNNGIINERDVEKAKSQTLEKQNRDQQTLISGCQNQAIALLKPEPFKEAILYLDDLPTPTNAGMKRARWLVLTNKTITPLRMAIGCNSSISELSAWIIGSGMLSGGPNRMSTNQFHINISTPAWSAQSPLLVDVLYFKGTGEIQCSFNPL